LLIASDLAICKAKVEKKSGTRRIFCFKQASTLFKDHTSGSKLFANLPRAQSDRISVAFWIYNRTSAALAFLKPSLITKCLSYVVSFPEQRMSTIDLFQQIQAQEIAVGTCTPWQVFDARGNLLMDEGIVIESEDLRTYLLEEGYRLTDAARAANKTKASSTTLRAQRPAPKSAIVEQKEEQSQEFDNVRWHIGETMYLQVADNASVRYTVKLIGFIKGKSILVTAPTEDGKGALIRDGQQFIVRAFPGKNAYAFTASAIKSLFSPHPYLHISYPKQVNCTTIRQGSRAQVNIIASVTLDYPARIGAAILSDLSIGGTSGVMKVPLGKAGDVGVIKFKVIAADNEEYLSLSIVLRSVAATENQDEFRHGFEFVDLTTQSKLILSAFVHQTLAEMA
jgi:c-di-GMP-binding flagellar brake protein YcgR